MLGLGLSLQKGISAFNAGRALVSSYIRRVTDAGGVLQNTACDAAAINELNQDRLLEPASWVLVPDGIKEDIVFAQKPTSGLGDLTFTRASDATYTDSTGVVRRSPYNLFTQSVWTGGGVNVAPTGWAQNNTTGNIEPQTAINGSVPYRFYATNGRRFLSQSISLFAGQEVRFSVFVNSVTQPINIGNVLLQVGVTASNLKHYINNVEVNTLTNITANSRIAVSFTATTTGSAFFRIGGGSAGDATYDFVISQPQLVEGTSALEYFPTTNRQDVPRIDFRNADGTLSSCGRLLLEPQRTNSIRNSSMVGAVAGSPGTIPTNWLINNDAGLTRSIVGFGTENGLPYFDVRYNGTANTTFSVELRAEQITQIAALTGQAWSHSVYMRSISSVAPPSSIQIGMYERTSAGAIVTSGSSTISLTSSIQRFTLNRTLNGGATVAFLQPFIAFLVNNGTAYDFTIRIAAPQMELGAYATTWVPTTTAAVTRIADNTNSLNVAPLGITSQYTIFYELGSYNLSGLGTWMNQAVSSGNCFEVYGETLIVKAASGDVFPYTHGLTGSRFKGVITFDGANIRAFKNGVKYGPYPANLSRWTSYTNLELNLTLLQTVNWSQVALFPTALSDDQCEVLTSEGYGTYALLAQSLNCVLQ